VFSSVNARSRKTATGTIYVMGGNKNWRNTLTSVERFNTETGWSDVQPMPTPRFSLAVAVLDNLLYAIGGYNRDQRELNTVEMYNPRSGQWTTVESMNTRRSGHGAAAMGGLVYVVGGYDERRNRLETVEYYNVTSGQWKRGTSMTQPRYAPGVVELGGRLCAMGGWNFDDGALNTVEITDVTNTWSSAPSMNKRRSGPGAATLGGKIYVAGGNDGLNLRSVEMFDPSENVWRFVSSMRVGRWKPALVNGGDGKLYVMGGWDDDINDLSSVEVYSPETDTWTDVASMESCAGGVGAGVL